MSRRAAGPSGVQRWRIAYLVTHPIQYQAPLLRLIAAQPDIDLTVFFQSDLSLRAYQDPGFGRDVHWDVPLLDGYRHEFLPALGRRDSVEGWRPLTYGLATRLWRGRFDALWIHGYARWINWIALLAARLAGIPVLVRDEATAVSAARSGAKARLKRLFFGALDRTASGFLAIGSLNRDYYLQNGVAPERIFPMPYCVDNAYFAARARQAAPRREALRAELGLTSGRPVVLYASKFTRRKRAIDLICAIERLIAIPSPAPRPYLLLAGDGDMRAELEARAQPLSEHVRFLGFRNQSELPALFDLCDVFVLPSEREPWGLIVNEVMSAGRPVIVSDQVGCGPDLVRSGINGFAYPVGDVDALARALSTVLASPEQSAAMGQASTAIMADWDYARDLAGLRAAVAAVTRRQRS